MSIIERDREGAFFTTNRIEALTDGVFAIVMTLLVLDISIPEIERSSVQAELPGRLLELWPKFYSYALSFVVLGLMWISHRRIFHYIKRSNSGLLWVNIIFLMFVALIPFSTSLIGDYRMEQFTFVVYGINLFLIFAMMFILWTYATGKYRLVDSEIDPHLVKKRKLSLIAPSLIVVLTIGISFVNVTAAFSVLVLMLVYSFVAQRVMRLEV
ncbi:TMEM175 family protein [Chloroflexota bacterium]